MLTPNAVAAISSGADVQGAVLQILDVKKISAPGPAGTAIDRYKMSLSDGTHFVNAMPSQSLNARVVSNELAPNVVVRLTEFTLNAMPNGKNIVIVMGMETVGPAARIGNPVVFGGPGQPAQAAAGGAPPPPGGAAGGARPGGAAAGGGGGAYGGAGPVAKAVDRNLGVSYQPVRVLNPFQNKWTIKVRVTQKGPVRTWSNDRGAGKLFSVDLLDEEDTEIRATFFKEGVDRWYDAIEQGRLYFMSGGRLKASNKKFTTIKHEYEISFDEKSTVMPCTDEGRIKTGVFNFVKIATLPSVEPNTNVDVAGVVLRVGDAASIQSKAGKPLVKRDVTIGDDSGASVMLTFWGEQTGLALAEGDVMALKGARLGDFGGRSLSTWNSTKIEVNVGTPEIERLRGWYAAGGSAAPFNSISESRGGGGAGASGEAAVAHVEQRYTIAAVREEGLGLGDQRGDLVTIKAAVTYIKPDAEKLWYPACPNIIDTGRACNKKLTDQGGGLWSCDRGCPAPERPTYRYIVSAQVADASGAQFATFFDAEGAALLGVGAAELQEIVARAGGAGAAPPEFDAVLRSAAFKEFLLTLRVKQEMVKDESRLKFTTIRLRPVAYAQEARALLEGIKKFPQHL